MDITAKKHVSRILFENSHGNIIQTANIIGNDYKTRRTLANPLAFNLYGKISMVQKLQLYICRNGEVSLSIPMVFSHGVMTHLLKGEELKLAAIGLLLPLSTVDCERVFCLSSVALSTELL